MFPVGKIGKNIFEKKWYKIEILILSSLEILSGFIIFFSIMDKLKGFGFLLLIIPIVFIIAGIEGISSVFKK